MNSNHILTYFIIGKGMILLSCDNNQGYNDNEIFIKTNKIDKETGNIIYSYKRSKDSIFDHAIVYDSMYMLKNKSYYEGNNIIKYINYFRNGNISDISYAILLLL